MSDSHRLSHAERLDSQRRCTRPSAEMCQYVYELEMRQDEQYRKDYEAIMRPVEGEG